MRISYWSSDVCSSDLWCNCAPIQRLRGTCHSSSTSKNISISRWRALGVYGSHLTTRRPPRRVMPHPRNGRWRRRSHVSSRWSIGMWKRSSENGRACAALRLTRSEEHTSELQSLMRTSYAVFCLKKKKKLEIIRDNITTKEHTH